MKSKKSRQLLFRLTDKQARKLFSYLSLNGVTLQAVFSEVSELLIEFPKSGKTLYDIISDIKGRKNEKNILL